jgi:hypothetical protein
LLYVVVESVSVPTLPWANKPPLEYYPFALTESRNNLLYVIAESIPIPSVIQGTKKTNSKDQISSKYVSEVSIEDTSLTSHSKSQQREDSLCEIIEESNSGEAQDSSSIQSSSRILLGLNEIHAKVDIDTKSTDSSPIKISHQLKIVGANQVFESTCSLPNILQPERIDITKDQEQADETSLIKNRSLELGPARVSNLSYSFLEDEKLKVDGFNNEVKIEEEPQIEKKNGAFKDEECSSELQELNIENLKRIDFINECEIAMNTTEIDSEGASLLKDNIFPNKRANEYVSKI